MSKYIVSMYFASFRKKIMLKAKQLLIFLLVLTFSSAESAQANYQSRVNDNNIFLGNQNSQQNNTTSPDVIDTLLVTIAVTTSGWGLRKYLSTKSPKYTLAIAGICSAIFAAKNFKNFKKNFLEGYLTKQALNKIGVPERYQSQLIQVIQNNDEFKKNLLLKQLETFPFNHQITDDINIEAIKNYLSLNESLPQNSKDKIIATLRFNQNINPDYKKIIVLNSKESYTAKKTAKELASALNKPSATINCDNLHTVETEGFLGSTQSPGKFFNLFAKCATKNPVIILTNLSSCMVGHMTDLISCLKSSNYNAFDRCTGIYLPIKEATIIIVNDSFDGTPTNLKESCLNALEIIDLAPPSEEEIFNIICSEIIPKLCQKEHFNQSVQDKLIKLSQRLLTKEKTTYLRIRTLKKILRKVGRYLLSAPIDTEISYELFQEIMSQDEPQAETEEIPAKHQETINIKLADIFTNQNQYKKYINLFPWKKDPVPSFYKSKAFEKLNQLICTREDIKVKAVRFLIGNAIAAPVHKKGICFVGATGVGKTLIAKTLASASNRKTFVIDFNSIVNLPGDPTNLNGAEPSDLLKAFCETQSKNPAIVLDNIDKATQLNMIYLEKILNPEKSFAVLDYFSGLELDVSSALFITTAKDISEIPSTILAHLEIIELKGYTTDEKDFIAARALLPNALKERYLSPENTALIFEELLPCIPKITQLIASFDKGLHNINRAINELVSQEAIEIFSNEKTLKITPANVLAFMPSILTKKTLNPAINVASYSNEVIQSLEITAEQFRMIENHIASLKPWQGSDSITFLYLEWLKKYPFNKYSTENSSLAFAKEQLDSTHYGLEPIKELILDFLAGMLRTSKTNSSSKNICLVGGAGIGKTTIAESIAKALGRPFVKISMESISSLCSGSGRYESFGSGPWALGRALCTSGCLNPVVLLDEIEKANDHVQRELLEILDPAQNKSIKDGFLGFNIDASKILFLASANDLSKISHPLSDRLYKIELDSYSAEERCNIARQMILPQIQKEFDFSADIIEKIDLIIEPLVEAIINTEFGVRNLKRFLYAAANKYARMILESKEIQTLSALDVIGEMNSDLLQMRDEPSEIPATTPLIGVVNGMMAGGTQNGGIHKSQASVIPGGSGNLITNAQGGASAQASQLRTLMFIKTFAERFGITQEQLKTNDFAITKQHYSEFDGPSAGIAQTVALISALTKRAVKPGYAITGAIDAYGNLLPVGGYRQKILGTARVGIKNFIIPECAKATIDALMPQFEGLNIIIVKTIDEVVDIVLEKK
jgi:ATP-dependent Lon protease